MTSLQLDSDHVLFEVEEGVALITLNRPESGNSISLEMHAALPLVWAEVRDNPEIRVAILTGAGQRHLSTGADMKRAAADGGLSKSQRPFSEEVRLTPRQNRVWKPVICAVNGLVAGGGLHFVVDADLVVAVDDAEFLDTHVNVGQVVGIENVGLARRLPLGTAIRMTVLGSDYRLSAARAYQLGLVDELTTRDELMIVARRFADQIKRHSPAAVSLSLRAVWGSLELGYTAAEELGFGLVQMHRHHPDAAEGPRAFMEKREPNWTV
jgi:enoyl-CoA hydratase/carnithine racemase